jgi:restriction endonuclease S subunit
MNYAFSNSAGALKVFLTRKSEINNRWDPFYFQPELVALEEEIRKVTPHQLRDFVISMSGGATPSTKEAETYYTENADGVPFIRVQNLSTTSRLNLEDCKLIRRSTHEGLLARSRLTGGELLVKITGVGRMAVASVVPENFEGNINQHIVAIRTTDAKTSETLAAYLNLDMAERLASRRSTGGTRPALDYPALLSIPIIFDERIPELITAAVNEYEERRGKAKELLAKLDNLLLDELGIQHKCQPPNNIESRIFTRALSEVSGGRLDPIANQEKRKLLVETIYSGRYPVYPLRQVVDIEKNLVDSISTGDIYVGLENINGESGEFIAKADKESVGTAVKFQQGQILFPKLRPYLNKTYLATFDGICSTEFHVFTPLGIRGDYLTAFLRSRAIVGITSLLMTGNTLPRLQMTDIARLPIPIPPQQVQERLCSEMTKLRSESASLRANAMIEFNDAKQSIEALILGKGGTA